MSGHTPFHQPPVHKRHVGYALALPWVIAGITRFHRIEGVDGLEHVPKPGTPLILVANHQNGLMDPLVLCTLLSQHHLHWLTRSDIFKKPPVRSLLFSFNMLPIYRRRDRLADIGERNQKIFKVCVDRLNVGAAIGLFPEGNHHGERSLRPLKRGVIDMLNLAQATYPELADEIVLLPVGLDYEDYGSLRRRIRYRIGQPIPWQGLRNEEGVLPANTGSKAIAESLKALMVDVQPAKHYSSILPFVQALRSTEQPKEVWPELRGRISALQSMDEAFIADVEEAWKQAKEAGVGTSVRPEDLGISMQNARKRASWTWLLSPFVLLPNALNYALAVALREQARKKVKDVCFVSTFKTAGGMAAFPILWAVVATFIAVLFPIESLGAIWTWVAIAAGQTIASRIGAWWYGHFLDEQGSQSARAFWNDEERAQKWTNYLQLFENNSHE